MQVDIDDLALQIGINVRFHRKHIGITQLELARMAGYSSHSVVANIESGRALPSIESLYAIAIALRCTVHELLPEKAPITTI